MRVRFLVRPVVAGLLLAAVAACTAQPMSETTEPLAPVPATPAPPEVSTGTPGTTPSAAPPAGTSAPPTGSPSSDSPTSDDCGSSPCPSPHPVVDLQGREATEISGLTRVTGHDDRWFGIDDGSSTLLLVDATGAVGSFPVDVHADNPEAIASGPCEPGTESRCLFIADTGDNSRGRSDVVVIVVAEPDPAATGTTLTGQTWSFSYPDGPHDAEAMLVTDDAVVILTKPAEPGPTLIYTGPRGGGALSLSGEAELPPPTRQVQSLVTGNVVTDADLLDGRLLLLTYDQVLEYRAPAADSDIGGFADWPMTRLPTPDLWQAEAITSAPDGRGYTVASEAFVAAPARLARYTCE